MIMSTLTMPGRVDAPAGRRLSARRFDQPLTRLWSWIAHALSVRRSARALARLDDRMLRDIGLRRSGLLYATHADCERGR
jgi:uncharacterized protein YjiS (DUF1127 family)